MKGCKAILRMDTGFCIGMYMMSPGGALMKDPCHLSLPEAVTVAHMAMPGRKLQAGIH